MRTISRKLAADLGPVAEPTLRHPVDSVDDRLARLRLTLDTAWRRKMDEVIALSKAFCGLTSDDEGNPARPDVRASSRLEARTERAYDELAAIEDAIARIDDGTYGMCASCDRPMSEEWLADKPEVRYCPDCYLRRVSRQEPDLPGTSPSASVHRARAEQGPGVRQRQSQPARPASAE
jgi:DnaK suppressor protein